MRLPARPGWLVGLTSGCVLLASRSAVAAEPAPADAVRVAYSAPPECPGEEAFLTAVRARIGRAWEAPPDHMARTIAVTVRVEGARSVARIDFTDGEGRPVSRIVSGETCSDAVAGIALVTALAIESRIGEGEPAPASQSEPPAVATSQLNPAPAPPTLPAQRKPGRSARAPWHVDLGLAGAVAAGVGPSPAFGGRFVAGLGWPRGPDVRVGVDYLTTAVTTVPEYGGVRVQMYEIGARASACPVVLSLGGARVLPCAGVSAGTMHAETRASIGVRATGGGSSPYVAPFAELRVDVAFHALFVEASGEVRFFADRPTFALEPPNDQSPLYPVPVVAAGGTLGLGLRL
jgi:hypothetical protein